MRLSRKIFLLALLNLVLLAALLVGFGLWQMRIGPESLLLGPARDRILWIGNAFSRRVRFVAAGGSGQASSRVRQTLRSRVFPGPSEGLDRGAASRFARGAAGQDPPRRATAQSGSASGAGSRTSADGGKTRTGPPPPPRRDPPESVFLEITHRPTQYWVGVRVAISGPDIRAGTPAVLLIRSNSFFNSTFFFDWPLFSGVALSVTAVTALCWLPFIRALTRSIGQMDRVTAQIAEGRFDAQVANSRSDELGHLGRAD